MKPSISLDRLRDAAMLACRVALEKSGEKVTLLDFKNGSGIADFFIVVTSRSSAHARSLAESLEEALDRFPLVRRGREGYPKGSWILLDYYGLVVHILAKEERDYYNLEKLWAHAERKEFTDERDDSAAP